jgi:myo-inositol-1(or 4)-monophosphatase
MNLDPNKEYLDTAIYAAKTASDLVIKSSKREIKTFKSQTDLVTETDLASEKIISDIIKSKYPDHSILAEESGLKKSHSSEYIWVIDPLDGTTNFVHEYPSYAVSIALINNGEPVVGVVIEMPLMNIYCATINSPAYCNNNIISCSDTNKLILSLLVTGFSYDHNDNWNLNMKLFKEFTDITQGVRRLGSAAIDFCHTAIGHVDGFWEFDLNPWDVAAGILIAKQAGAKISKLNGEKFSIYDNEVLVTNGHIHQNMINVFNELK